MFENKIWEHNFTWISYDVKSLYTSIPHDIALMALNFHFSNNNNFSADLKEYALQVTDFLMTHNFFCFTKSFILQLRGVSIGVKYSPSLANLVMSWWEEV